MSNQTKYQSFEDSYSPVRGNNLTIILRTTCILLVLAGLLVSCVSTPPNPPPGLSGIQGIDQGEIVLAGTTKVLYVSVVGGPDLTIRWEDKNGPISSSNKTSLVYTIPNVQGEAVITVVVTDKNGGIATSTTKYQIILPTPTPTLTPTVTPSATPTNTPTPSQTPTETQTPMATPTDEMKSDVFLYTPIQGDTLASISKQLLGSGMYAQAIGRADCIVDKPVPGKELTIKVYTVRSGDTLGEIADKFGMSVNFIRFINDFTGDTIYAGQKLILPIYGKCQ